ncbi:MAG: hypothetical protein C0464_02270 [Cyanobacteria bacterium DS2.008]|nr:hypothetical protein [Cyanobacteria bacterium DS2.008]
MIIVKHKYIAARGKSGVGKVAAIGKTIAHMKYIQNRPGEDRERDHGGRDMFNDSEDRLSSKDMKKAIRELGEAKVIAHKLTLAPEISPEDKKAFTREVMKNLSRSKGLDLDWFAVEHNNTDHHHIHVVVLGKDRNGTEVGLHLRDIEKAKEYGDRYLEREHPREFERARDAREAKERERLELRKQEWKERDREGLELPWMKRGIVREQLEPYKEWRQKQGREEKERAPRGDGAERPYHNDSIKAVGQDWSRANTLGELQDLNQHLWENYGDRIPVDEYKKLSGWIRDKERARADDDRPKQPGREKEDPRNCDSFEHGGKRYGSKDSYDRLKELATELREKKERLPIDDYNNLRGWIEDRDRARFSGALEKGMKDAIKSKEHSKTSADLKAQEGGRVINPLQDELMRNPVVGLFMTGASIANTIVGMIKLTENKDHLKDNRQELEMAKIEVDKEPPREKNSWDRYVEELQRKEEEERKAQVRENIMKAIGRNEEAQKARERRKKEKKEEKEREERGRDDFERGWWGR